MIFVDGQFSWGIASRLLLPAKKVFTCSDNLSDGGPGKVFNIKAIL